MKRARKALNSGLQTTSSSSFFFCFRILSLTLIHSSFFNYSQISSCWWCVNDGHRTWPRGRLGKGRDSLGLLALVIPRGAKPWRGDQRDKKASELPRQNRKWLQGPEDRRGIRFRRIFCSGIVGSCCWWGGHRVSRGASSGCQEWEPWSRAVPARCWRWY